VHTFVVSNVKSCVCGGGAHSVFYQCVNGISDFSLENTNVNDVGMTHLKSLKSLRQLSIARCKHVTAVGVKWLPNNKVCTHTNGTLFGFDHSVLIMTFVVDDCVTSRNWMIWTSASQMCTR
jgi:hypothetical protein